MRQLDTTDVVIAQVSLLRAVDRLLAEVEVVRARRENLSRVLREVVDDPTPRAATAGEARRGQ